MFYSSAFTRLKAININNAYKRLQSKVTKPRVITNMNKYLKHLYIKRICLHKTIHVLYLLKLWNSLCIQIAEIDNDVREMHFCELSKTKRVCLFSQCLLCSLDISLTSATFCLHP